jgi:hypothetical protein
MIAHLLLAALALMPAPQDTTGSAGLAGSGAGNDVRVQMGVLVRPDTVTVGEHFQLLVRVRAPRGSQISFPPGPDSGLTVEAVDPREVRSSADSSVVEQTAMYTLVAWDTGSLGTRLGDLVVTTDGRDRRITITGDTVHVRSVLPADSALRVPKPARAVLAAGRPWWYWLLAAIAALALMGLLIWWWRRRRGSSPAGADADAYQVALREFERIAALGLLEAGEPGRYVALNTDAVRDYLAARLGDAPRSFTSTELLASITGRAELDAPRLASLLTESDLIKFARRPVSEARARELGAESRGVVDGVEAAVKAEEERAAAAEAARAEERATTGRAA